jgi:hypothetical protein
MVNKSNQVGLALQQNPQNAQSTWLTQQKSLATTTEFPQFSDQVLTMQLLLDDINTEW